MSPAQLLCAASTLARETLTGPPRPARVIAVARQALYLLPHGGDTPLAVLAPQAVRVPNAVVVPNAAGERPFHGVAVGDAGRVGCGRLAIGPLRLAAREFWAPPRAQDTPPGPTLDRLARLRPPRPLAAQARPAATALVRALAQGAPTVQRRAAVALLGLGPGATPSGDDFLCGLLLTARLARRPPAWLPALADIATHAEAHTPPVSAALLRHAAAGYCVPQAAALLDAAATGTDLTAPVAALLAVGHSSGSDLLHGLCAGARLDDRARHPALAVRRRSTPS
ncbi:MULTISPECIES: DUF2877 domain-containing protein [unclassified Streptomyces]|uniref:oxamate carbamoyltransferase subunit AllH family protein n=1 Tax=unclassified Streptomyces TaxID=2593676 RepID=UPI00278C13E3|nr:MULTISPECIES: DUF2877 domain-containing protein [unclassified Streptomyces]